MLAILGLVSIGLLVAALVDSGSSGDGGGSNEPDSFSEDEDAVIDQLYRPDVEANLLDLVTSGEISQTQSDTILDRVNFTSGTQNIDTGGGDDVVVMGPGNDTIVTGDGDDVAYGGTGNDEMDLGLGDDVSGYADAVIESEDDFIGFPEIDENVASQPEAVLEGGNDRIFGGGGNDAISDSFGSNFVNGEQGDDFIDVRDAASDTLTPDRVKGGFGFDTLLVDEGDTVETGRGFDTVTVDVFAGVEAGYQVVTITDFEKGKDTLELEGDAALIRTATPTGPGDMPVNPITVAPLGDGSGSMVFINGIPVVQVNGPANLGVEDIVLST